jgi:taurine dioxygenase
MTSIDVQPIRDDLRFGACVRGLVLDDLRVDAIRRQLVDAFEDRGVLVFEDVEPTPAMQVAISTVFGPLKDHPSKATPRAGGELGVIEIRHEANAPGVVEIDGVRLSSWLPWHFDHCYNDKLNRAGVLRAVEIVPDGGRTGFVDGIALYEAVAPEVRERVEGREVLYAMDVILDNLTYGRPPTLVEISRSGGADAVMTEYAERPRAIHPAVWTRDTGQQVLHVSPWMAKGIVGLDEETADAVLHAIAEEINDKAKGLCYFHQWRQGDMVIWDNWRILHSVSGSKPEYARCMHRTTIEGDYGLGRFEEEPAAVT